MISFQSGRQCVAIRRNTPDRAYEQLLEAMTVLHSGTLFTTVRVNEDGSINPISLVLRLDDVTTEETTLPPAAAGPPDEPWAGVSEHPFRNGRLARNAAVADTSSAFTATAHLSQQLSPNVVHHLRDVLREAPRFFVAEKHLDTMLPANSAVADRIVRSFDRSGIGIRVQLEHFKTQPTSESAVAAQQGDTTTNLVVTTAPDLDEWAAFAESVAAMNLLLSTIEREVAPIAGVLARPRVPEANQPMWTYLDGGFRSHPDSWTFCAGVRQARELIGEPGNPVGLIDLGCGSAAPIIGALVDGSIDYYIGVDLDQEALRQAQLNLATINQERYRIDQLDVTQRDAAARIKSHMVRFPVNTIWILGANLPYLPTPEEGVLDRSTDGGRRGLDLTPRLPLALATDLGSKLVVLNVSSLCDLDGFLDEIETTPFLARRFIGTAAPLEAYARKVVDYVRTNRIGRPYDSYQAQIICAYVLQRASGISAKKALTYLERLLVTPILQPDLAVACGDASGEVTILTPVRPLACRSLAFSVARSARNHAGEI
ncbi:MAG: hypothetical protein R6W76_19315 [Caldilinea sp.]